MSDASLILATHNAKKLAELRRILEASSVDVSVTDLSEYPDMPQVAETGATFTENALLKARAVVAHTGRPAVAEDSGLCIDALNGMPGVLSARWAGRHGDDEANLRLVLGQLADVPTDRRAGHFACVAALVLPSGREQVTEGTVSGRITDAPRGTNGFGYDPIFVPAGSELTTAEMSPEAKDAISHRGRALRALAPIIAALLGGLRPAGYGRRRGRVDAEEVAGVSRLEAGDEAPDFTLTDADGKQVTLSALRGQQVIVYFYPAAMTPGCTKEACDFRDSITSLAAAGVTVLGISPDAPAKLAKFRDRDGLNFPLLSDPDHKVHEAYGAWGEKKLYGKTTVGVIRSTFVVDKDGKISRPYYNVKATGHVARLRQDLGL